MMSVEIEAGFTQQVAFAWTELLTLWIAVFITRYTHTHTPIRTNDTLWGKCIVGKIRRPSWSLWGTYTHTRTHTHIHTDRQTDNWQLQAHWLPLYRSGNTFRLINVVRRSYSLLFTIIVRRVDDAKVTLWYFCFSFNSAFPNNLLLHYMAYKDDQ